jgi:hypothetical protein
MTEVRVAGPSFVAEIDALVEETTRQVRGIAHQPIELPAGALGAGKGVTFCSLWPTVKAVLQALQKVVGGWIKIVIGVLIAAGDAVCPPQAGGKPKP